MPSLRPVAAMRTGSNKRGFDEHIRGVDRAARLFAAHDAADAARRGTVGDHAHLGVERVGLAVEREQRFAVFCKTRVQIAGKLVRVEHMQRPAAVIGHEIRHIDQRGDRAQSDRAQAIAAPIRGLGPFFTLRIKPAREHRARVFLAGREIRDGR